MAQVVEQMPARARRKADYPFEDWFDGQVWLLEEGEDFKSKPLSLRSAIYAAAKTRGVKVKVAVRDDQVYVTTVDNSDRESETIELDGE